MVIPEMRSDGFRIVPAEKLPLTEKCRHYTSMHEVPWDIQKYAATTRLARLHGA